MNETFMKEKPVFPLLMSMALPMVLSMLVNSLYNIVDSYFVAKVSEDAMTALSLVYPIQNFINAVSIGYGVGMSALIALYLGAEDKRSADTAATQGFLFSILHGVVITIGSIALMPAFLRLFTTDETVVALGVRYANIAFLFSVINMMGLAFEKIFQAVGWMKVTMLSLTSACVFNIILDPLLIFGVGFFPELGIDGAALATGLGQTLALVIYLIIYSKRSVPVRIRKQYFAFHKKIDLELYAIGIPAILNLALPSLLVSALNSILSAFSHSYVVVLGIYYKLQTFLYLSANGMIQGMRPIIGYNFGARERKRVKKIYDLTLAINCLIMAVGTVVCLIASRQLIGLFTDNPETILYGETALRIISAGFIISAVSVTSCGALEGIGKGAHSLIISLCRYVVIIIPSAFLLCRLWGPGGVWNAFWVAELATAVIAFLVYQKVQSHHWRKALS